MNNNIFKLILLAIIVIGSQQSMKAYDFEVEGIYYDIRSLDDLTCDVVGASEDASTNLFIKSPLNYNGRELKVLSIDSRCFEDSQNVRNLKIVTDDNLYIGLCAFISSTIESLEVDGDVTLGVECFARSNIKSVVINGNVSIGVSCFEGCSQLEVVQIDHYKEVKSSAFENSGLKEFKWPVNLKTIPPYCFAKCSFESFIIPDGVTTIDIGAFCRMKINELRIPNTIVNINNGAFAFAEINKMVFENGESTLYLRSNEYERKDEPNYKGTEYILYSSFFLCNVGILRNEGRRFSISDSPVTKECIHKSNGFLNNVQESYNFGSGYGYDNYPENRHRSTLSIRDEVFIGEDVPYFCENHCINWYCKVTSSITKTTLQDPTIIPFCEYSENFTTIKLNTKVPPTFDYEPNFTNENYIHWNIYVPIGTKEVYLNAPVWKKFWNIIETDFGDQSGIKNVNDKSNLKYELDRYDINGIPVTEEYTGLVIIRYSDGSTEKRYVR